MLFEDKQDTDFVPGKYANDTKVFWLLLSAFLFMASLIGYIFDTVENATYLVLASVYFNLLFIAVDRKRQR